MHRRYSEGWGFGRWEGGEGGGMQRAEGRREVDREGLRGRECRACHALGPVTLSSSHLSPCHARQWCALHSITRRGVHRIEYGKGGVREQVQGMHLPSRNATD